RMASSTASEIWSAILSGCPSDTDSEVKMEYSLIPFLPFACAAGSNKKTVHLQAGAYINPLSCESLLSVSGSRFSTPDTDILQAQARRVPPSQPTRPRRNPATNRHRFRVPNPAHGGTGR